MAVKAIPDGFTAVTPHLVIDGAAEAIEFYKRAFGAEELGRMAMPDGKRLMHAMISIGGAMIMLVDAFDETCMKGPKALGGTPVTIHLYVEDAKAAFDRAVKAGCEATMPLAEMFWGDLFGTLRDPFGHSWSIAQHVKDLTPEQMEAGAKEAMAAMASAS